MPTASSPSRVNTTADVADNAIETLDIKDGSVTPQKLENGNRGEILYAGVGGVFARLAAAAAGKYLKANGIGADPSWEDGPATADVQTFSTAGTFTWNKPANAKMVRIETIGGGGAGGNGNGNNGGAGGGGALNQGIYSASLFPSSVTNVIVGAGGVAGGGNTSGGAGGASSFYGLVVANGGGGGINSGTGGAAGTAVGGISGGVGASNGGAGGGAGNGALTSQTAGTSDPALGNGGNFQTVGTAAGGGGGSGGNFTTGVGGGAAGLVRVTTYF